MSINQRIRNIALNEVVPKHMGTNISSVSNDKIDIWDNFRDLYSDTLYSLYPDLFNIIDGMLFRDELFRDKEMYGRNVLALSNLSSIDQLSVYVDK